MGHFMGPFENSWGFNSIFMVAEFGSARFVPLITSCTVTDPNQRPSMRQVIDQLDTIIM